MNKKVERNYLEINSISDLNESNQSSKNCLIKKVQPANFQLNKFFYKNVGRKHHWVDRLVWNDKQWMDYLSNEKVETYVLNEKDNLAGFFELIIHRDENEVEIAYLGLLEEY